MPERLLPVAGLLGLGLIWGSSFLFIRLGVLDFGPMGLVLVRCLLASIVLGTVITARGGSPLAPESRRYLPRFLGVAVMGSVIPWLGLAYGELTVPSGLASIFNATTPLWAATLAWWVTPAERPSPINYLGVGLGFLGTVLLVVPALGRGSGASILGVAACLVAGLSYAGAALWQRRFLKGAGVFESSFWQMTLAGLVILPIAVPTLPAVHLTGPGLFSVLALGLVGSGVANVIYYWLLNRLGAAGASSVTYLLPVTAVVWGAIFLHERVTIQMLAAGLVVLAGVLITNLPRRIRLGLRPTRAAA